MDRRRSLSQRLEDVTLTIEDRTVAVAYWLFASADTHLTRLTDEAAT